MVKTTNFLEKNSDLAFESAKLIILYNYSVVSFYVCVFPKSSNNKTLQSRNSLTIF